MNIWKIISEIALFKAIGRLFSSPTSPERKVAQQSPQPYNHDDYIEDYGINHCDYTDVDDLQERIEKLELEYDSDFLEDYEDEFEEDFYDMSDESDDFDLGYDNVSFDDCDYDDDW